MKMTRLFILFTVSLFLCLQAAYAVPVNLAHITVKDGLPNSTVYYAMQDTRGFIWFCTATGVSRYDGNRFENFTISEGLADNEIFKSYEDSRGRVWFLSYNGKLSYFQNGKIYNGINTPSLSYPLTGAFLLRCMEDKQHNIWFSTSFGNVLKVTDSGVQQFTPPIADNNHNDFFITAVLFEENDTLQKFITNTNSDSIYKLNLVSRKQQYEGRYPSIITDAPYIAFADLNKKGTLFISDSCFALYNGNNSFRRINTSKYGIRSRRLSFLQDGRYLWIATESEGAFKIDMMADTVAARLLNDEEITHILKDNEGNLWFLTHNNGIFFLKSSAWYISTLDTRAAFSVASIHYNGADHIICGGDNGAIRIFSNGEASREIRLSERRFNRVLDIIPQAGSRILIGCDEGLFEYDLTTGSKKHMNTFGGYKSYTHCPDGSLVFCSQGVLAKLQAAHLEPKKMGLPSAKYTDVASLSDSVFYIGTTSKLYKMTGNGLPVEVMNDNMLKTQVSGLKNVDGVLWVATHGNGIFIVKGDTVIRHITAVNGIASNICEKLYDDGRQYMWLCTNEGLSVLDRKTFTVCYNINADAGLISNDVKNVSTNGEQVYVATSGGVNIFRLQDVLTKANPPAVYVTGYKKGGIKIMDPGSEVAFNFFKGFININITGIAFQAAHSIEYEYKLEGESEWHRTRTADIPIFSLAPGTHNLLFRAKTYNSDWSKAGLLTIIVNPLWYQTFLFRAGLFTIVLLLIYFIILTWVQIVRKKARDENEYNQKIRELENRALTFQMNPHFIFNSLNTVQHLILVKEEQQSLDFLTDFSILIRKMLENSRRPLITLDEEIEFLEGYMRLEATRFSNVFKYHIAVDSKLAADDVKLPPALIQPLLENAIKHGIPHNRKDGFITLSFEKDNNFLVISVEDNGVGIYTAGPQRFPDGKKESTALKVLEERLRLITGSNGDTSTIIITDKGMTNGTNGTIIQLRIPILT